MKNIKLTALVSAGILLSARSRLTQENYDKLEMAVGQEDVG